MRPTMEELQLGGGSEIKSKELQNGRLAGGGGGKGGGHLKGQIAILYSYDLIPTFLNCLCFNPSVLIHLTHLWL